MTLRIQNRQRTVPIQTALVKRQALRMMTYLGCTQRELSVVFASDQFMQTLNQTYRQRDYPTNVLAFPQHPAVEGVPEASLLGDVVIALPTALREAHTLQQTLEARVVYLLLHGLLHLLGYDHEQSPAQRRAMERLERQTLTHLAEASGATPENSVHKR